MAPMGRRRCGRCLRELPLTSFNRSGGGHQWWCRECYRTYFNARGGLHRDQSRAARDRRRQSARSFISDFLRSHRCTDCGEDDARILEFDHLGEKRGHVSVLVHQGASERRLLRELATCDVVCVNCHRVRTAERGGSWRLQPDLLELNQHLSRSQSRNMAYVRDVLTRSSCVDCGDRRLVVLEFDHVGVKSGNVTDLARRGCGVRRLQHEISECVVRCGNCHRRRTLVGLSTSRSLDDSHQ